MESIDSGSFLSGRDMSVHVEKSNNKLVVCTDYVEVHYDIERGAIPVYFKNRESDTVFIDGGDGLSHPDISVCLNESLEDDYTEVKLSEMGRAHYESYAGSTGSVRIEFLASHESISVIRTVTFLPDSPFVSESIEIENISDRPLLIDRYPEWENIGSAVAGDVFNYQVEAGGVDYCFDGIRINPDSWDDEYVTPACAYPFFHNHGLFAEMGDESINLVAGHHGSVLPCIMAYNESMQEGLLVSCISDQSLAYVHAASSAELQKGTISARLWWARWLNPGERQRAATFIMCAFVGDYADMLVSFRDYISDICRVTSPDDTSEDLLDELFVAKFPTPLIHALGDWKELEPYIDAVSRLGCSAVWQSGAWLDSCDINEKVVLSRCQPVSRNGRYSVTEKLGGEEAFKGYLAYAHSRGMKCITWITGYGISSYSDIFQNHPDAFIRLRKPQTPMVDHPSWPGYDLSVGRGDPYLYSPFNCSGIAGDTTNRHWRELWIATHAYWAEQGVDGFFFDSFNPMTPNYNVRPWPGQIAQAIVPLQREARAEAKKYNPDFFTFTEGGGFRMAGVNDFTHTWREAGPPPLPPFRKRELTPREEALFLRDEMLSLLPGSRFWMGFNDAGHRTDRDINMDSIRPRILYTMLAKGMPVIHLFACDKNQRSFVTETEYWDQWQPCPANAPDANEWRMVEYVQKLWSLRMGQSALKSGSVTLAGVRADNAAVISFVRQSDNEIIIVALNFNYEDTACRIEVDLDTIGIEQGASVICKELLHSNQHMEEVKLIDSEMRMIIPQRDAVVLKLHKRVNE
jgi:hypothetical protein